MALSKAPQPVTISTMSAVVEGDLDADLDAIVEIERLSFPSPWAREAIVEELGRAWARVDLVRDAAGGEIVAFANYWLVADELHVLNIATHPRQRRQGHGTRLLAHMIDVARALPCRLMTLEVRRSNAAAQRLYRRFAFRAVGVRPAYYAENQEDAIVMLLELS
ncbi:MAG TPA: ribosomal protein S18-alanine N-acetyltransferase [Polyangia bacterium]|jgi:ribosomal-protein-alanine N-acetyltransferase